MEIQRIFVFFVFVIFIVSCKKETTDNEAPLIVYEAQGVFPKNCDTLYRGDTFVLRMKFTDNVELHSFSAEITHNFDGHTHSGIAPLCETHEEILPVYPFFYMNTFLIPSEKKEFVSETIIWIPFEDCCGTAYDTGDYHLKIKVFDKQNNNSEVILNVKIADAQ
jgi:hypothetical protein